jgi:hypothetical protein
MKALPRRRIHNRPVFTAAFEATLTPSTPAPFFSVSQPAT